MTPDLLHAGLSRLLRTKARTHNRYSTMTPDPKHPPAFRRVRFMSLMCEVRYTTMTLGPRHTSFRRLQLNIMSTGRINLRCTNSFKGPQTCQYLTESSQRKQTILLTRLTIGNCGAAK